MSMRIVLADEELMFRDALRQACTADARHEVVGEADDGEEAVRLVSAEQPNLLFLELDLPRMDGFAVAEAVRQRSRGTQIIAVTASRASYTLLRVERGNFEGYIDKGTNTLAAVRESIAAAASGRRYYSAMFHAVKEERMRDPKAFDKVLSDREQEVLGFIGMSFNDDEIAQRLGIAARTVETFRHRILQKLGIAGTPKLIRFALEKGFTPFSAVAAPRKLVVPPIIPPAHFTPGARIRRLE